MGDAPLSSGRGCDCYERAVRTIPTADKIHRLVQTHGMSAATARWGLGPREIKVLVDRFERDTGISLAPFTRKMLRN